MYNSLKGLKFAFKGQKSIHTILLGKPKVIEYSFTRKITN